jgi:hypothetical protein
MMEGLRWEHSLGVTGPGVAKISNQCPSDYAFMFDELEILFQAVEM